MNINAGDLLQTIQGNGNRYTRSYTKQVREADDDVESFQEKLVEFKKVVRKIHNYSSTNTTDDKAKSYLSDLADTYNSLVSKKDSLTDSSLNKQLDKLDTLIDDNAKALKKLGLKKTDGKLEFDEDTFDDNTEKTTVIKNLFEGTGSFGDQLYKITRSINKSADKAQYVISEKHLSSITKYDESDILNAQSNLLLQQGVSVLNYFYEHSDNGNVLDYNEDENKKDIVKALEAVVTGLNNTTQNDKIMNAYEANKDDLEKLWISYSDDDGEFKIGVTYDEASDQLQYAADRQESYTVDTDAFNALFNSNEGSFYSEVSAYSKEGYNNAMKLDSINVKVDEYV